MHRLAFLLLAFFGLLHAQLARAADAPAQQPAAAGAACTVSSSVDSSALPAADLADPKVQRFIANAQALVDEDFVPLRLLLYPGQPVPAQLAARLVFIRQEDGIAWASGGEITVNMKWFADKPDDLGAIYHELAHVVQAYPDNPDSGWLVEGIADWARYFHYEGHDLAYYRSSPPGSYRDAYTNAARFLEWLRLNRNADVVTELNARLAAGKYDSARDWPQLCGADLDALWAQYSAAVQ
jgi:hypothetical protein